MLLDIYNLVAQQLLTYPYDRNSFCMQLCLASVIIEMPFSQLSSAMSISNIRAFLIDSSPTVFISVQHVVLCSLTDLTNSAIRTKLLELNI